MNVPNPLRPAEAAIASAAGASRPGRNDRRAYPAMDASAFMSESGELDFEKLYKLARDKSVSSRSALVATVGDLFLGGRKVLTERERALMSDILRHLIREVEMSVRKELADRLATRADAPHDLVVALANDDIDVAHPILLNSDALQDIELVEIIRHRTHQHQLAIAMRKNVSEIVSDALVENGSEDVVRRLLENSAAAISQRTMEYLVEQSERLDSYQNPLLKRTDLSKDLAKRMYWWVSAALREHIVKNFKVDPSDLDETIEKTVETVAAKDDGGDKSLALARELQRRGELSPAMLLRTLRQGEISLFEAMVSEMTNVPLAMIRRVIYEQGGEALAICCRGLGIDKSTFASIFLLSRQARGGDKTIDPKELSTVLALFDRITVPNAKKILTNWQRDPAYLDALYRLQTQAPA